MNLIADKRVENTIHYMYTNKTEMKKKTFVESATRIAVAAMIDLCFKQIQLYSPSMITLLYITSPSWCFKIMF